MSYRLHSLGGYFYQYQKSVSEPEVFWAGVADSFYWRKRWDRVLDWEFQTPAVRWFVNGKLNITENIFDRRLFAQGSQVAIIWEPNHPGEASLSLTYNELFASVCAFGRGLRRLGVTKGDRVAIYLPMIPEAVIAMLACARIGAVHSVVFAGFSASSLAERIRDCSAKVVITADEGLRGEKITPLKRIVDEAVVDCESVRTVVTVKRTGGSIQFQEGRDVWWHELVADSPQLGVTGDTICPAEEMDSEDLLFILYTSGSTGRPKGVVHTTGGYMIYTHYSFTNVFQYNPGDVYWCSADVGWITGHSYIVYGPLLAGATVVLFEGVPTYPDPGRFWAVIDKHQVNQFYTAPTAIRALQAQGLEHVEPYDRRSLKVLGTVGEPINEDAWHWYHTHIGRGRCPVVDTWWQTETGGVMISPMAGITPTKPGFATLPLPGIQPVIVDEDGCELVGNSVEGNLCIKYPWPSMLRTTYGDHTRCRDTYFSRFPGLYFTGDGARRDEDGYYRVLGRVDDVLNVSGHRLGTAEIENAINEHPRVVESAVVGYPHEVKGQAICTFAIVDLEGRTEANLIDEIRLTVSQLIGPFAKPERIYLVPGLPKTRSGKIMRRILRLIAAGSSSDYGDTSTLLNPDVVSVIEKVVGGASSSRSK